MSADPEPETRVLLLRHAETATPHLFHGAESDVDLGERGRQQAQAVAAVLALERPAVVISSAMRRARATASPIAAACGVELHIEADLHERRCGALSGTPVSNPVWPATLARWLAGDTGYAPPGAESFDDVRRRVVPVWERLTTTWAGRTLAVVAHGNVCKVLLVSVVTDLGIDAWESLGPTHNAAITELVYRARGWRIVRLNHRPQADK